MGGNWILSNFLNAARTFFVNISAEARFRSLSSLACIWPSFGARNLSCFALNGVPLLS